MNWRLCGARGALVFGTAAVLSQPSIAQQSTSTSSVTTYRYDSARSGYTPGKLDLPLAELWRHTTTPTPLTSSSFAYKNGTLYVAGGGTVYAINAADGSQVWKFPADKPATAPFYNTPVIDGDALYIGGNDQRFYKLDVATGKQIWVHAMPGTLRSPAIVTGDKVFFGCENGTFYALNTADGKIIWSADTGGPITSAASENGSGEIAFASSDNKIYYAEEDSGRVVWAVRLPTDATASPPVYSNGAFITGAGRDLYALAERRGNQKWTTRFADNITTPVAVSPSMLYLATAENRAYGVSDRGRVQWGVDLPYPSITPPLVVGSNVVFSCGKGALVVVDGETGKTLWQYVVQPVTPAKKKALPYTNVAAAPIFADNALFVLSDDGTIGAYKSSAPDNIGPIFTKFAPEAGSAVNGKDIAYGMSIVDEGSGIKPDSLVMTVDGKTVPTAKYVPSVNGLKVDLPADVSDTTFTTLSDGLHQVTVSATDWRGNTSKVAYAFTVDNTKKKNQKPGQGGYPGGPGGYPGGPGGYPGGPGGYPGGPGGYPGGYPGGND
jgi:outer membrane protein assembly factor BamB